MRTFSLALAFALLGSVGCSQPSVDTAAADGQTAANITAPETVGANQDWLTAPGTLSGTVAYRRADWVFAASGAEIHALRQDELLAPTADGVPVVAYTEEQSTNADTNGIYYMLNLQPGTYILEAQLDGYSKQSPPFEIPEQHFANLLLE